MTIPSTSPCIVIGGGAVGLSVAYHLARAGMKGAVLLERGALGEGSTGACMGGIRLDFSTEVNVRFSLAALPRWEGFAGEFGVDPGFRRVGYLMLASLEEDWALLQESRALHARLGVPSELLPPEEIARRWPFIRTDDLRGGSFCGADGYAGPQEAVQGYARRCRELGVRILQETPATGIRIEGARVRGVETPRGSIETDCAVCCAGPWAAEVARMAGVELPVRPIRRQVFASGPVPGLTPGMPLTIDLGQHTTYKPEGEGFILYGPQDAEPSYNTRVDWEAAEWAVGRAARRIPAFERARILRGWAGLYEVTPDNHGIMGGFAGLEGFHAAAGFSGHGFQHSPAIGQAMAERILEGEARSVDIGPLAPDRFARGAALPERLTAHHAEAG
ncbi:MAG: FAD-binding oxidoreductase [Candidatus Tectomicrobia bacterium]|uniref:FAD-binding oxidoreductase n=1 Tax=Tectimicrobiota bacterium TaxID=2528274 RepID=A0A932HZ55_UNCTE|nr:FAD-binding oxidoreductase [Candidatus Tectomicrobia bacterium]